MFERFTDEARTAVVQAQVQARRLGHDHIGGEHVLLGVLAADDGVPARVLRELGVDRAALERELAVLGHADADALASIGIDLESVRRQAESTFGPGALDQPRPRRRGFLRRQVDHLPFTASARKGLEQSLRQALALGHGYIGAEHLVLGLIPDDETPTARTLRRLGVKPADVRARLREELGRAAG
ncbi:Clp protease N-terminal domain-containing protein [Georgenia yuyongxinii]|uniref:Clp protease n=1 Tax=Georgenia yuyongxinii TaxID=2589797 RepID=A0A552WV58_9MICO|nr:Clp protease N-terminal domain-containing protein [Georgenia yuyongxinii]TRW46637.1 Clp protease [Georgenia yuyongxinii]